MPQIDMLSQTYADYRIYPKSSYVEGTPATAFLQMYDDDPYATDLKEFLELHTYDACRRGADLSWWGSSYFSSSPGRRTMIISQDSLSPDAGSITLFAHLWPIVRTESEYDAYIARLHNPDLFRYKSWLSMRNLLNEWGIDVDYAFVTDAAKVYRPGSWTDGDFDFEASVEVLWQEIELCSPDLVVLLGQRPLRLIDDRLLYKDVVGTSFIHKGLNFIAAPFPIGQGRTQKGFKEKMERTTRTVLGLNNLA